MGNPKETPNATASFEKSPNNAAAPQEEKTTGLKACNPSVCVGNQKPTSCVCVVEK